MMRTWILLLMLCVCAAKGLAQDTTDLISKFEGDERKQVNYTTATFKSTRLITGHSVENIPKGVLDVRILHRFAPLNTGIYNFFGLDQASMRMGFDYGITNNFMIGIGHSTWQKTYDAFFKIKILRQSSGAVNMPVTVSYVPAVAIRTDMIGPDPTKPPYRPRIHTSLMDKTSFSHQLIIGRKFSTAFSMQLMPTFIHHHNRIDSIARYTTKRDDIRHGEKRKNTIAMGIGGRLKVSKRISLNAEYYYQLPETKPDHKYNSVSLGVDIETGGHVFQLHFTNSNGMTEKSFITDTDDKWKDGSIRFGFNISRVFNIGKH